MIKYTMDDIYKLKRHIKQIGRIEGVGTTMISILIKGGSNIYDTTKLLTNEYSTSSNIKSKETRNGVLSAIKSSQQLLKKYNKVPPNGLIIYCGQGKDTKTGKTKKIHMVFEPVMPLALSTYICDSKFFIKPLEEMLEDKDHIGYVCICGDGCVVAKVNGTEKKILAHTQVQLPKKHGKGGQSAQRFGRLRENAINTYLTKCAELISKCFIVKDTPIVSTIIIAGIAQMKDKIQEKTIIDYRLTPLIKATLVVSYGGLQGLNEAIIESRSLLSNFKLAEEQKEIAVFFNTLIKTPDECVYGRKAVMTQLLEGNLKTLIIHDEIDESHKKYINDDSDEYEDLLEFIIYNYSKYGCKLHIISDSTSHGSQIVAGFDGIVGIAQYAVYQDYNDVDDVGDDFDENDFI